MRGLVRREGTQFEQQTVPKQTVPDQSTARQVATVAAIATFDSVQMFCCRETSHFHEMSRDHGHGSLCATVHVASCCFKFCLTYLKFRFKSFCQPAEKCLCYTVSHVILRLNIWPWAVKSSELPFVKKSTACLGHCMQYMQFSQAYLNPNCDQSLFGCATHPNRAPHICNKVFLLPKQAMQVWMIPMMVAKHLVAFLTSSLSLVVSHGQPQ